MMVKNDYRRSLIMLRVHAQGYSGHVRLERRTLIGSMYVAVSAPGAGTLCATLIRRDSRNAYSAVKIGELRQDCRGQATLAYSFDPRNIDGRPLEDYLLIAIVHKSQGNCDVVLSGNLNGSQEVNWTTVRAAACAVCSQPPACDLCPPPRPNVPAQPGEGPLPLPTPSLPPENVPAQPGEGPLPLPTPSLPPENVPAQPGEGPLPLPTPSLPPENVPAQPGEGPLPLPTPSLPPENVPAQPGEGPVPLPTPSLPDDSGIMPLSGDSGGEPAAVAAREDAGAADESAAAMASQIPTGGEALGIDLSAPWPGVSESVRGIFARQPVSELMLDDGYTYVRAPMPEGSGYDHVEIGVHLRDGVPDSVAYALPSRFSLEPPAGLEDYTWQGGSAEGWWTIRTDPETGEIQA